MHVVPAMLERYGRAQEPAANVVISPHDLVLAPPGTISLLAEWPGGSFRESITPLKRERIEIGPDSVGKQPLHGWYAHAQLAQHSKTDLIIEHGNGIRVRALIDEFESSISQIVELFDQPVTMRELARQVPRTLAYLQRIEADPIVPFDVDL
jgi:hypothetical protein